MARQKVVKQRSNKPALSQNFEDKVNLLMLLSFTIKSSILSPFKKDSIEYFKRSASKIWRSFPVRWREYFMANSKDNESEFVVFCRSLQAEIDSNKRGKSITNK